MLPFGAQKGAHDVEKAQEERPFTQRSKFTNMELIETFNRSFGEGDSCKHACVQ